ncbi:hypothetical protein GCM10012275_31260 [Longimycelium tulufanense]|uniref:Septum formation-related domain-containing protein n=2 Tax=Longimycelium tulufanense TaxID=907463 RepID=A0A8J3CF24_9PSEU|nr:hypothetical protein GCM10012275_31260 [Longimycelium tulufanense]
MLVTRREPRTSVLVLLAAMLVVLPACTTAVAGQPTAAVRFPHSPPVERAKAPPGVGTCLRSETFDEVPCESPHEGEVSLNGVLPDGLPSEPDDGTMLRAVLPTCRKAAVEYLSSTDADATRLQAWAFWPSARGLADGQSWLVCAVFETGPDEKPATRTGSLRGALAGEGFDEYQQCTAGSPGRDERLVTVPCDQPHLAEAVPGVLSLGAPHDPAPGAEEMTRRAQEHCTAAVEGYLGASRDDVVVSWRMPSPENWAEGYNNVVCYVETTTPLKQRLRGIGTNPLPT